MLRNIRPPKRWWNATFGIAVPPQLVPSLPAGTIVELRYKDDAALEPLISQVAQDYGVSIDVLHANVEYFGSQAIGILIVLVSGAGSRCCRR